MTISSTDAAGAAGVSPIRRCRWRKTLESLVAGGKSAGLCGPFHAARGGAERAGFHEHQCLHARGKGGDRQRDWRVSNSPVPTARRSRNGCGTASACITPGLLPKYRVLVEQLAQQGPAQGHLRHGHARRRHQRADPHRALHASSANSTARRPAFSARAIFTRSAGAPGAKASTTAAGSSRRRRSTSIENLKLEEKAARGGKKFVKRKPPEKNFVNWDKQTFARLIAAPPERLELALPGHARHVAERAEPAKATAAARCSS